ncbi:sulfotransferase domain-containing protein [Roseixanthobacter pseudopolyaromaticivorans]|uniref:sulfotransferase domain-containing protein n=1 Tax=Xanthobacteraceae TaxID=335928 RepID=UPI003726C838
MGTTVAQKMERAWAILRWRYLQAGAFPYHERSFLGRIGNWDDKGMRPLIVVQSHRRSGTHFLIDEIRARFPVAREWMHLDGDFFARLMHMPVVIKSHDAYFGEKLRERRPWHSYMHWVAASSLYTNAKHVYIVRNPRDVLRSQFYFDLKGHEPAYRVDPDTSFADYVKAPSARDPDGKLSQVGYWCAHVKAWLDRPEAHILRYEDLLSQPEVEMERLATYLGLELQKPRTVKSSAIGRKTTERRSKEKLAAWGPDEERLLEVELARHGLPDFGYGIAAPPAATRGAPIKPAERPVRTYSASAGLARSVHS